MLVAGLILLAGLLTGATWYYTPEPGSMPVGAPTPTPENPVAAEPSAGRADSDENQTPVATNATFAPFLHIVPGLDGTDLFISAGGPEVGGTVVANVSIAGGSCHKGDTMTYSDTIQAYVTTMYHPDLTPGSSQEGNISITTTLGQDTGEVGFNRVYVPSSTIQSIDSTDGNLQLQLVNTDTITYDTYVAVVPSYGPPGPAPLGHRFVGSTYSVRAAGALVETGRPMSLRLYYNDTTLAGSDPHTLAIFAWDAHHERWDNLGGTLFSTQQHLSVATSRFATYALMATPSWRDEFDDLSGMDLFNNVTWGGTPENRTLVLVSTATSGSAVSNPITPTATISNWGSLTFTHTVDPPTTTLTVDVLSLDDSEVLTDVASGTDLADLVDPAQYPSLRLRVNMSSTVAGETPALERWELAWQVEEHRIYLPVILR
jgi:hypothetical protein